MEKLTKKILITGGGSGGHISPITGLLEELKSRYSNVSEQVLIVGGVFISEIAKTGKSIEQTKFENKDIPFVAIRGGKIQRSFSIHSIRLLTGIIGGFLDARKVVKKFDPDIIISTGGYVTLPVCIVGWLHKVPVYVHEQTAAIGLTNKIAGRIARKIYVSFKESETYLPRNKTMHTGNIVRKCIFDKNGKTTLTEAIDKMLAEKKRYPIVYISGGGQGSHIINLLVRQMLPYLLTEFQIIHQVGDNNVTKDFDVMEKEKNKLEPKFFNRYYPVKFVADNEIGYVFDKMDIFLGRAGANTVYEMGIIQKPSIFIPIPWVTHNEQTRNAEVLVKCKLARILPQGEATAESLFMVLKQFARDCADKKYCGDTDELIRIFPRNAATTIIDDLLGPKAIG